MIAGVTPGGEDCIVKIVIHNFFHYKQKNKRCGMLLIAIKTWCMFLLPPKTI